MNHCDVYFLLHGDDFACIKYDQANIKHFNLQYIFYLLIYGNNMKWIHSEICLHVNIVYFNKLTV